MAASSSTGSEVPLRKKIKTKSGIEHNFVPDYLSEKIKDIPLHQVGHSLLIFIFSTIFK